MIYVLHHDDTDGIVAAWAAWRHFKELEVEVEYIPVQYGRKYPLTNKLKEDDEVYVLDFSYSKEFIEEQRTKCKKFFVIDHHKTASHLADMEDTVFNTEKAGCRLAWEYFHDRVAVPWVVIYAEDYDLWKFDHDRTKDVQNLLLTCEYDFEEIEELNYDLCSFGSAAFEKGKSITRYKKFCIDHVIKGAKIYKYEDYKCAVCMMTYPFISEAGSRLNETSDIDFSLTFFVKDLDLYVFSLRSKGDFDVSEIATQYGGGGHKNAAGFSLSGEELEEFKAKLTLVPREELIEVAFDYGLEVRTIKGTRKQLERFIDKTYENFDNCKDYDCEECIMWGGTDCTLVPHYYGEPKIID